MLNGLRELCEKTTLVTDPPPSWIRKSVYRGRNKIFIKPKNAQMSSRPRQKEQLFTEIEEMSVAGSDITIINRGR